MYKRAYSPRSKVAHDDVLATALLVPLSGKKSNKLPSRRVLFSLYRSPARTTLSPPPLHCPPRDARREQLITPTRQIRHSLPRQAALINLCPRDRRWERTCVQKKRQRVIEGPSRNDTNSRQEPSGGRRNSITTRLPKHLNR